MSVSRAARGAALAVVVATALFAMAASPSGALTDPQEWGKTFCTETVGWLSGALQGAQQVQEKAADPSLTPTDGKQLIVDFLDTGVHSTKSFGQSLKQAGAPDIPNGAKIHAAILAGIAGSGVRLAALEKAAKALPTKPPTAFEKGATTLGNRLKTFTGPFQKGLGKADKLDKGNQLGAILQSLPACAPLLNGALQPGG